MPWFMRIFIKLSVMFTRYWYTWACSFGLRILFTSPSAPSIRRHITAATSGNHPRAVPPAKIDRLSADDMPPIEVDEPPNDCGSSWVSILELSAVNASASCIGESLIDPLSIPLEAVGEGLRDPPVPPPTTLR
uniref:Putative secreted protein n=1 Tax=Anopheles triannulatus TaxID=58253 RepID=A0A2M4B2Z0_9DIPT